MSRHWKIYLKIYRRMIIAANVAGIKHSVGNSNAMFNHQSGSELLARLASDASIERRSFCGRVLAPIDRLFLRLSRGVKEDGTVTYVPTRRFRFTPPTSAV